MSRTSQNKRVHSLHGFAGIGVVLLLVSTISQSISRDALRELRADRPAEVERPPLYLPSVEYVKLATLGFNNFASDILWFNTINYFGKQLRGARDYQWLGDMCDLVTELDPKKGFAYEFCAHMLAWEAKDFQGAAQLLDRAVLELPNDWRYAYLRGFTHWYFLNQRDRAREDLTRASKLPNAPAFLAALAGRLMVDNNDVDSAVVFLKDMLANATDENARKVLTDKLNRAYLSRDTRSLNRAVERFAQAHRRNPTSIEELTDSGILRGIPPEPFGGQYVLDPATGKVTTTTGEKGLEFFGKTKDTGIFNLENSKQLTQP